MKNHFSAMAKHAVVVSTLLLFHLCTYAQNVGIGTNSPVYTLDVRGVNVEDGVSISVGNSDLSHRLVLFGGRLNDTNPFLWWKAGDALRFATDENGFSELMRISPNGNVGIGTNAPLNTLDVRGATVDGDVSISVGNSDLSHRLILFGGRLNDTNPFLWWKAGDALRFATDENGFSELMRISSNGNVGIGTTSPDPNEKLHIHDETGYNGIMISNNDAAGGSSMVFKTNNNEVFGQIGVNGSATGALPNALFIHQNGNHPIKFGTYGFDRMIITGAGNVGIGTSSPNAKLQVAGNVKIADGTQGAGKVLTSDANGLASWQPAQSKVHFKAINYTSPIVVPNNLETIANYGDIIYNTNIVYNNGSITVPSPGLYHFDFVATTNAGFSNTINLQILTYINGALQEQSFANVISNDFNLNAGDQVVFKLEQTSGSSQTISAFSRLNCHKVY